MFSGKVHLTVACHKPHVYWQPAGCQYAQFMDEAKWDLLLFRQPYDLIGRWSTNNKLLLAISICLDPKTITAKRVGGMVKIWGVLQQIQRLIIISLATADGSRHLAFRITLGDLTPLVISPLAFRQRDFHLRQSVFDNHAQRHNGVTALTNFVI